MLAINIAERSQGGRLRLCSRAAHAPANVVNVRTDTPEREIDAAPGDVFALIMTHSHPLDNSSAAAALRPPDLGLVGLIGSATKQTRFISQVQKLGIGERQIARLVCPIGHPDIKRQGP
jgi:xanthine dehydrogenase accessory factor